MQNFIVYNNNSNYFREFYHSKAGKQTGKMRVLVGNAGKQTGKMRVFVGNAGKRKQARCVSLSRRQARCVFLSRRQASKHACPCLEGRQANRRVLVWEADECFTDLLQRKKEKIASS